MRVRIFKEQISLGFRDVHILALNVCSVCVRLGIDVHQNLPIPAREIMGGVAPQAREY